MRGKTKKAIALQYEAGKNPAPRITAKGRGPLAERIITLARENGVPIKDDPDLVEVLSQLEINDEIPPDLYVVIAELLAFVYKMNGKFPPK